MAMQKKYIYIFPEMQEPLMFRSFITLSVTQDFNQPIYI